MVDLIDDHSRYLLATLVGPAATGELAWDTFETAASRYGLPRQVLSDNGLIITGRLHHVEVAFESNLGDLGVDLINSAPYHPQTLGKLERFHRTLKEWLTDEGPHLGISATRAKSSRSATGGPEPASESSPSVSSSTSTTESSSSESSPSTPTATTSRSNHSPPMEGGKTFRPA